MNSPSHALGTLAAERANLRSAALLEPYSIAASHLERLRDKASVVTEPSPAQSYLEGSIIGALGHLFDPERRNRPEAIVPLSIEAEEDHLTVVVRGSQVRSTLHGLLPRWERGAEALDSGIPGLRYNGSTDGAGVTFYLLDQPGRVTFRGISVAAFEQHRVQALHDYDQVSVLIEHEVAAQELVPRRSHESARVASIVGRRLGILLQTGVSAIDSWWNTPSRFVVELSVSTGTPDPMPQILSQMLSPHLAPQLRLDRQLGEHHYLAVEGSTAEIDLRILWVQET